MSVAFANNDFEVNLSTDVSCDKGDFETNVNDGTDLWTLSINFGDIDIPFYSRLKLQTCKSHLNVLSPYHSPDNISGLHIKKISFESFSFDRCVPVVPDEIFSLNM